jgi:hypothetical protein
VRVISASHLREKIEALINLEGRMAGNGDKPIVLSAYAKAIPELRTAIHAADGDILGVDFAKVRNRWFMRLSWAERRAIRKYESATASAELGNIAPEAINLLRRLGCKIDRNENLGL